MTQFAQRVLTRVLVSVLVALVLAGLSFVASAETIPATGGTTYAATNAGAGYKDPSGNFNADGNALCMSNGSASCAALAPDKTWDPTGTGVYYTSACRFSGRPQLTCAYTWTDPWGSWTTGWGVTLTYSASNYSCNAGDTLSGSTCTTALTCPAGQGYTLSGSNCTRCDLLPGESRQPDGSCSCPSSGTMVGDTGTTLTFVPPATVTANTVCFGFCQFEADGCIKGYLAGTLAGTECYGPLRSSGASCNPATFGGGTADPTQPLPREPNKPGHCWGTIGDQEVQLPCDSTSGSSGNTKPSTTTTTNPDGTTKETTETTETTTNCTGEACKTTQTTNTTTTTRDAQGNPTGTTTETRRTELKPQDSEMGQFCQQNPKASVCQQSKWGGTCSTAFQCEGDAVQCAVARELHTRNCQLMAPVTGGATEGEASSYWGANSKGQGLTAEGNPGLFSTASTPTFDTTARGLSGGALADYCQTVQGVEVCIPFTKINPALGWIGAGMLLVALMMASRIYATGLLGGA